MGNFEGSWTFPPGLTESDFMQIKVAENSNDPHRSSSCNLGNFGTPNKMENCNSTSEAWLDCDIGGAIWSQG